jgi:hypothetical protein
MQQRLKLLNTLPVPMYGTAAPGLSSSFASSASQRMFHSQPLVATSYDQLCPVQFTAAQRRMLKSLYKHDANKSNYKSKRRKIRMVCRLVGWSSGAAAAPCIGAKQLTQCCWCLCQVRMKDLDRIVEGMEKGKLLVLCCMADWNPLCRKVISVLEAVSPRPNLLSTLSVGSTHPLIESGRGAEFRSTASSPHEKVPCKTSRRPTPTLWTPQPI